MDRDPELDVTLSDGRRVVTFQITTLAGVRDTWLIVEPGALRRVIRGEAAALATRQRVDSRIAARLAAGWVPVDGRPVDAPPIPPTPVPPDLGLQISGLLEALARGRPALQAADPSGLLWAACQVFRHQAWRFGVGAPGARLARARQERRLGELAEQAGDRAVAIVYYRAALASFARVGVKRHLASLTAHGPAAPTAPEARVPWVRHRIARVPARRFDSTPAGNRAVMRERASRSRQRRTEMKGRIQIVGRLPVELSRRVRATAKRRKVSLNAFLIEALTQALGTRRAAEKEPR